ncbi:hypothetical protein SAMN05444274_106243 [Mariniphaga anaerophila]|uniref:Damage-control phosphatase ARMT1-like metal-binding domain-containing protein n=1 Tax=Mariniphaga anaerophila TaxID=1484053 RepID=A0A1M5CS82_9BACT|nr:ARMT1-like domain-containing protein [Mariniphaga anaerophila]SHF57599.1 hypothetical protein SAMN05444274_106243 [Mariniphaga anaerophila]
MSYECLICQIKSLQQRLDKYEIPEEKRDRIVSDVLKKIAAIDLEKSYSPENTRNILAKLKEHSTVEDPYREEKENANHQLLSRYNEFRELVNKSSDRFDTALRLAVAGNIIDFGPGNHFDLEETIKKALTSDIAVNDSKELREEIKKAKTILYLADNCGEVVLDKLFLETIAHPNVWYAVRNEPVLNDVTEKEARAVGIDQFAKIIPNGYDAPSTLLHKVSSQFLELYNNADLIISKGMGNFEGLMHENNPRLFFLFMVKCPVISRKVGAAKGELVVKRSKKLTL